MHHILPWPPPPHTRCTSPPTHVLTTMHRPRPNAPSPPEVASATVGNTSLCIAGDNCCSEEVSEAFLSACSEEVSEKAGPGLDSPELGKETPVAPSGEKPFSPVGEVSVGEQPGDPWIGGAGNRRGPRGPGETAPRGSAPRPRTIAGAAVVEGCCGEPNWKVPAGGGLHCRTGSRASNRASCARPSEEVGTRRDEVGGASAEGAARVIAGARPGGVPKDGVVSGSAGVPKLPKTRRSRGGCVARGSGVWGPGMLPRAGWSSRRTGRALMIFGQNERDTQGDRKDDT